MAFDIWIHLVLVLSLLCQRLDTSPTLKLRRDCTSFNIGDIHVEVKHGRQGRKAWRHVERSQRVSEDYKESAPVLDPKIILGNESNLNIVWTEKKLSTRYLIRLKTQLYGKASSEHEYLKLRLRQRKRTKDKDISMNFPCVELTDEPQTILIVEIWPLPDRWRFKTDRERSNSIHAIDSAIQEGRSRRSVSGKTICRDMQGQVQCSVTEMAALSLSHYIPRICHCSKPPSVRLDRLTNGSLEVSVWNLPRYAYNINVTIRRVELIDKPIFNTMMNRTLIVEDPFPPGNYVATVRANCAGEKPDIMVTGDDCSFMGTDTEVSNVVEVSFESSRSAGEVNVSLLAGILAVIVATSTATIVVFCKAKCKTGNTDKLRNSVSDTKVLNSTRYSHQVIKTEGHTPNNFSPDPVDEDIQDKDDNAENSRESEKLSNDKFENSFTSIETIRCSQREHTPQAGFNKIGKIMLLYHPDSPEHEYKIESLCSVLQANHVNVCKDGADNWRDFAEMAGSEYPEIIIILSEGLLKLCKAYENKSNSQGNNFDVLRQQRKYDYIPCVAMKKLQTLIQENPANCPFSLHFVSFRCGKDMFQNFRDLYGFLKSIKCCFYYNIYTNNDDTKEIKIHTQNLKRLITALT